MTIARFLTGLIIVVFVLLSGCGSDAVNKMECTGYYVVNRTTVVDVVNLMPDGRYAHYYIDPDGNRVQDLNTWTYDSSLGYSLVALNDWYESFQGSSKGHGSGTRCFPVDRSGSRVRLTINDDLGQYYYLKSSNWQEAERVFDSLADIFFGTRSVDK